MESLETRTLFALSIGPYATASPAIDLANALLLNNTGITVTGANYVGVDGQAGLYAGFDLQSGSTRLAISDGVILTSGSAQGALGPNDNRPDLGAAADESTSLGIAGDPDLDTLVGIGTQDANALVITFTVDAGTNSLLFDFVFGSEEFPDFVGSFNDAFAAYLDGTQISFDINNNPITVNNNFFQLNNSGVSAAQDPDVVGKTGVTLDIEYDGLTPVIRTQAPLDTNLVTHTLKFVIADASDSALDSGVFISRLQGSTQVVSGPSTDLPQPGLFNFNPVSYLVSEGGGFATITILREGGSSGLVTVDLFTTDGDATANLDYTPFPLTTITFLDGQTSTTVTIPIINDLAAEGDETLFINLSNPTNAAGLGPDSQATLQIIDDELGVEFIQPVFELSEGTDDVTATITVVLTGPAPTPLTVDFATTAGGSATPGQDYTPVAGTLTFVPGQTSMTFTVPILDDFLVTEATETINVALSNVNAPFALGLVNPAVINILNLDRPPAVLDVAFTTNERFLNGVALRFSEPMEEPFIEDVRNFDIFLRKESKKLGGSATRSRVKIVSAVYEEISRTVTLTTRGQLRENKVYEVIANTTRLTGLESVRGQKVDGNYDNVAGDDFTGYLSRSTKITYFDKEGDRVTFQLVGPGRMELFRNVERDARQMRLLDTSRDTILNGVLEPQFSVLSNQSAVIETLLTGNGFRNKLPPPPTFIIEEVFDGFMKPNT